MIALSVVVTIAALTTWWLTGGEYYTKFQIVDVVERATDPDDPLAGTGFYDGDIQKQTEVRSGFRLGLFPAPTGLFDKHMLSVASVVPLFWLLTWGSWWRGRRRTG